MLPCVRDPSGETKEESLHCNDIGRVDPADAIHVRSSQPTSAKRSSDPEELSLNTDHIGSVNPRGPRSQGRLAWGHSIVSTRGCGEGVIAGAVCRGRTTSTSR